MGCTGATSVDFGFYRDAYGGGMGVEAFTDALPAAERRVPACKEAELAYRCAVCAAAEAFSKYGEGQAGGFQLGSFLVTYCDNRRTTGEEQATCPCEKGLSGTGFLFCGAR